MPSFYDYFYTSLPEDEDREPVLYRYHSFYRPGVEFYITENECPSNCDDIMNMENAFSSLYLGCEIEVDSLPEYRDVRSRTRKYDAIRESNKICHNARFIYYMLDGSLRDGMELITQPCTFPFYQEHEELFASLFQNLKNYGYDSDGCRTCGLHIHFNRDYYGEGQEAEKNIQNLLTLMDRFWWRIVFCTRRYYPNLAHYAAKLEKTPVEIVQDMRVGRFPDRYHAINLVNRDTIEFRLYAGTLDINTFMCILELTRNLIVIAKQSTLEEVKTMPFEYLLTSERLTKYYFECEKRKKVARYKRYIEDAKNRH